MSDRIKKILLLKLIFYQSWVTSQYFVDWSVIVSLNTSFFIPLLSNKFLCIIYVPNMKEGNVPKFHVGNVPNFEVGNVPNFEVGNVPNFEIGNVPNLKLGNCIQSIITRPVQSIYNFLCDSAKRIRIDYVHHLEMCLDLNMHR